MPKNGQTPKPHIDGAGEGKHKIEQTHLRTNLLNFEETKTNHSKALGNKP